MRLGESLGWGLVGVASEAGVFSWGVGLVVFGAVGRGMWDDETSELLSSLSSSDSRVFSFRLFELRKDSPATLLSAASVSVRVVPSSSLSIVSRYSLLFRVGILEGAASTVRLDVEATWMDTVTGRGGNTSRVQRSSGLSPTLGLMRSASQPQTNNMCMSCTASVVWKQLPRCLSTVRHDSSPKYKTSLVHT